MATFALRIEYLTGTAVSTLPTDRRQPEWPPHPFRLMAALIASLYGTDLGEGGRACLQALEALPPPSIKVAVNAGRRALATTYVPTNDGTAADGLLPSVRFRAARHFPAAIPADPVVYMIWDDIDGRFSPHLPMLARLAVEVPYLGHSSSLVGVSLSLAPPAPNLEPAEDGPFLLRVPTVGTLANLEAAHAHSMATGRGPRTLPAMWSGYRHVAGDTALDANGAAQAAARGGWIVFRRTSRSPPPLAHAAVLTTAVRGALMGRADQPVARIISGHEPDGTQAQREHISVVPMANVGNQHGDGDIKGFAVMIPPGATRDEREAVHRAIRRVGVEGSVDELSSIVMGHVGAWTVARQAAPSLTSLQPAHWAQTARRWVSVTPYVFEIVPSDRPGRDVPGIVARSCRRIGLPEPSSVTLTRTTPLRGVPHVRDFIIRRPSDRTPKLITHLDIEFPAPVTGPVLIGSGRFQGLGLFLPAEDR